MTYPNDIAKQAANMEALLAIGAEAPPRSRFLHRFASFKLICAADSGLDLLHEWRIEPDIITGDMDSLSNTNLLNLYPRAQILRVPREKDESDTELGFRILSNYGATHIIIAGGGGGRLDHLLAIKALFEREKCPAEWHTAHEELYLIPEGTRMEFKTKPGDLISVFPLATGARGMSSGGLKWSLSNLAWGPGDYGLSNQAVGECVWIEAGMGKLLMIRYIEP